ncbi:MAG: amidohydrolase family protein [Alphaproteobacteria bacterium]
MPDQAAPIVDCHAHIFVNRMPLAGAGAVHPDYEYAAEDFVADLDRHGVTFGVIAAATLYGDYNDYTLQALRNHKRLRGTIIAEPSIELSVLKAMADAGVVGLRFGWRKLKALPDLRGYEHRRLFYRLADLGLHAQVLARADQMAEILPALAETDVRVVIDHFGALDTNNSADLDSVLHAVENGRTWVKLSAAYRVDPSIVGACVSRLLAAAGPERLLWGSDAPFVNFEKGVTYADTLRTFETLVPDPHARRAISDAALKLYFC